MARYQLYGGGGNNPCGAYYPQGGPLDNLMGAPNSDCPIPRFYYTLDTTQSITPIQTTRGRGICCDPFKRVSDNFSYTWENQKTYKVFDTVAGIGEDCPACFFHAYRQHTSSAPYTTITYGKNKPCETIGNNRQCTKYIKYWSTCKFLTEQEALPTNCTMHNSFGLIMANTQNVTHAGSPNGSCSSNCMQLGIEFFEERVAGKYLSSAQYPPNNYSDKTAYDCEAEQRDRKGNTGPTGPKLIWAGFAKNQWGAPILTSSQPTSTFPSPPQTPIPTNSSPVPGEDEIVEITWDPTLGNNPSPQFYPFRDTFSGSFYYGYLPSNASPANSWGLLHFTTGVPGSTFPQNESKLWARKSTWRIMPPGGNAPTTSTDDAFACCKYVSFGCTDPSFGSFNPDVELDCNGIPKGNTPDDDGNCLTINDAQGICWENGLQCSKCIDTTGSPDPNDLNFNPNYNNYFVLPADDPTGECTQEIFDSCGATGFLSEDAWIAMRNARPTSWLYGGGAAALGLENSDYGRARFWDKDGRDVTGGNFGRPLCQCNNSGCMYPQATNYSPLNTTDCNNDPAPPNIFGVLNQYGDVRCCTIRKFGCPEPTSDNYFCKIDLNDDGTPDNQEFCMNPFTGIPCNLPNANCGLFNGGVRLGKGNSNPGYNNPTVTLIDDGTCDLVLKPGCKDDGGISAGGIFANPVNPGYSALNFDSTATIHVQSRCEYAFGCPDPLAENVRNDLPVCGDMTLQSKANEINLNNPLLPAAIDASFVENNLIPRIECCDYQIPGTGPGCTDPNALNYSPLADEDCLGVVGGTDTSCCIYSIEGCTDPNAINFNPAATLDDSSCIYDGDYPVEGDNFLDGTPIEICREPLTKEEVLMNVCQPTEIQSEVFIERGKQSVFEPNQRLDEVKTIGGLEIYGYGFYNIKEEI